ncbi:ABC-type polysaccharide/polyol phosphate export permease [Lentzea fradiae]|uniref:Transport permease protein n=1 Tax=Lentzea fradiae TaxID=200378 RepID=A0A1G7UT74_9PSEU|nr:ABC transporter permease [Lentzea fradiae]SDG50687.1 ABC-type polysaccharide/polyol phosphate export permease [Lentzea fradiae]
MNGVLVDTTALIGRHLLHLRRTPTRILGVTLTPLTMVLVLGYMLNKAISVRGGDYLGYMMAGVGAQVALACVGSIAIGTATSLRNGLVDRFRSLPTSRGAILVAHTVSDLGLAAIGICIASIVGALLGWRPDTGVLSIAAGFGLLLLFTYVMLWFGLLLGLSVRSPEALGALSGLVLVCGSFLSNAFVPLDGLPGWLRVVAEWNPISAVSSACRQLWGGPMSASTGSVVSEHPLPAALVMLAVIAAVTVPLSCRAYHAAEPR